MKLIQKDHVADNVWSFRFDAGASITWIAGQFIQVELPHERPDAEGTKRWFTVSSAPFEGVAQITTRVTGTTFKQALGALPIGGELNLIAPPEGDFVWSDSDQPIVFIAGGIGITPFHSILKERFHDHKPLNVTLIYSGRTADLPFKDEFQKWAAADSNFKVTYVIGEQLTVEKLSAIEPGLNKSLVYLSGPEPMVEALGDQLKASGLPQDRLKQDFFPNYTEANY